MNSGGNAPFEENLFAMSDASRLTRKEFIVSAAAGLVVARQASASQGGAAPAQEAITAEDMKALEKMVGLSFTDEERAAVLSTVRQNRGVYELTRNLGLDDQTPPPTPFKPQGRTPKPGTEVSVRSTPVRGLKRPAKEEDLAFLSVRELGHLVRTWQVSSSDLTELYLDRLKRHGDKLLCLVTLTEELAREQAKRADEEIRGGKYRGPLHGIPYGLKDLFAVQGYPTTWGSEPHKNQKFPYDCAVYERLRDSGAVCLAKLSMGSLAQGDVWFKGRTKNPWNPAQGSSGSSAGSACATAAGLAAFTIGTETLGSIMSPSHQCRVSGLRPTFGRVSRFGSMALSWTMDKVGPIARTVEDCAIVFATLLGSDPRDDATVDYPYRWNSGLDLRKLKVGFLIGGNDDPANLSRLESDEYLKALVELGVKPTPVKFSPISPGINLVLRVESAACFDAFTRGDAIDELKNSSWPDTFRGCRYVPAVEYLALQRARRQVMETFEKEFGDLDVVVCNERGGSTLFNTNLTGHPQVLVPLKASANGGQRSCSVIGRLYEEEKALAVAHAIQMKVGTLAERPDESKW